MAFKLESALKIVADVTGTKDVLKLEKALAGTEKAAAGVAAGFKGMLSSKAFQAAAVGAAAIGAGLTVAAKQAISFEDKMAGVLKVMEDMNETEVKALKQEIMGLGKVLPIGLKGIADIYAAAGQAGVPREEMRKFAEQVGHVSVAFDVSAERAGQSMARMKAALGATQPEVRLLFDSMNHLGNNTAASSEEILRFMDRAVGAGKAAGLAAEQTAALGAAMIGSGVEARVAATALRSMVSALVAGESMTNSQVDALARLGIAQEGATEMEQRLTQEVERQSNRRIEAARNETDQIAKEINRRYRDQMTALRDNLDDQNFAAAEATRDRANTEIKSLQRQMQAQLLAARESGEANENLTNRIRDTYDARIDMIRDNLRAELLAQRRAARDRLTVIQDRENDRKDLELQAAAQRFKEIQALEKLEVERGKAEAKKLATDLSAQAGKELAEQMQVNALATITDIFERINALPKPERLSVINELFGEAASRGVINMINNMDEFNRVMGLVASKSDYAGSTMREFLKQVSTTSSQAQLAKNQFDQLVITFGTAFLPAINAILQAIAPVVQAFTWMLTNIPGLSTAVAVLGTVFVGLVAVAPIIMGIVTAAGALGVSVAAIAAPLGTVIALVASFGAAWVILKGVIDPVVKWIISSIGSIIGWVTRAITALAALFRKRRAAAAAKSSSSSAKKSAKRNAEGGFVSGAQLSWVGERGGEYIVPTGKAGAFAKNYMAGFRGSSAIPRHAEGGFVPGNANVSITTGPVQQMNGVNYVTTQEMSRAVQSGVNETLALLRGDMNIRREVGIA